MRPRHVTTPPAGKGQTNHSSPQTPRMKAVKTALAVLFVLGAGIVAWWTWKEPDPTPLADPETYAGSAGGFLSSSGAVAVPSLARQASSPLTPAQALALCGSPIGTAITLLGKPNETLFAGSEQPLLAWHSAIALPDHEPKQWPVAHLYCTILKAESSKPGAGCIVRVQLIGSLGAIVASNPSID